MEFKFIHPKTKDTIYLDICDREIQDILVDELRDRLTCDCQPVGETNFVECNCYEYLDEFELQDRI